MPKKTTMWLIAGAAAYLFWKKQEAKAATPSAAISVYTAPVAAAAAPVNDNSAIIGPTQPIY